MISRKLIVTILIPYLFVLFLTAAANLLFKIPMKLMVQDIAAIGKTHPLAGFLTVLGSFLWCAAAVICFFSARLLFDYGLKEPFYFAFFSGILSTYLLMDDTFQIHESISGTNQFFERIFIFILFITFLIYVIRFRRCILNSKYFIFLIAIAFMGISIFLDAFYNPTGYILTKIFRYNLTDWDYFFEDGFKWIGIGFWLTYFADTFYIILKNLTMKAEYII
jgi:hypothetical protein